MCFTWDPEKEDVNQTKHGVSYIEAQEVFDDPLHLSVLDERYAYFEERWITVGRTKKAHILVVANLFFTEEGEEIILFISAREATTHERRQYEEM